METFQKIICKVCKAPIQRSNGRINENLKLSWDFYCSTSCMSVAWRKRKSFKCENENCGLVFEKLVSQISQHNFCSRSCSITVNNKKRPIVSRQCARNECEDIVKGELKYCSAICRKGVRRRFTKEQLIATLQKTSRERGRVPAKREVEEIRYACVYYFGSWNNAILAAGLKPNRSHSQRMYRRMNAVAKDGHACDSISEARIDNWLTDHRVEHIRDAFYPSTHHRADWNIGGTFVEYFGLAKDSPRYDRAIKRKRELCRRNNIPLIEIYPDDLYPDIVLQNKLKALSG
ncbi:MAG: hypothetical protein HY006_01340 [Candidatus Sungbacteria bacterium]|nr:hypothetical protein [Candidatus Sungbacteria bacterium]